VAGNVTDRLIYNREIKGYSINGANFLTARSVTVVEPQNVQLTDFTVYTPDNSQFAAGTGMYFPNGATGMGYPYLGIYERGSMQLISLVYYDLVYPGNDVLKNSAGLRIKYSSKARAFYISGFMADRRFIDFDMINLMGKTKGFIMKINESDLYSPQVLVVDPDNIPGAPDEPLLCAVTDLEINPKGDFIAFTGITTKEQFADYHHPMVGMIDLDLNLQWCKSYQFVENQYSGVDVEFNTKENKLLVLLNSDKYPFSIMELDNSGNVTQQPVNYEFFYLSGEGSARSHIMHFVEGKLLITGNCFVRGSGFNNEDQLLYRYDIPDANNLLSGNLYFNSYSHERVPIGRQKEVTSYWTPENSIFQNGYLSIVGIYNNNDLTFGYTLIQESGFVNEPGCLEKGDVKVIHFSTPEPLKCTTYRTECKGFDFNAHIEPFDPAFIQECPRPGDEKSTPVNGQGLEVPGKIWQFRAMDEGGIHAVLFAETETVFEVKVYDATGRKIYSSTIEAIAGQKEIYIKLATTPQMYIISVNNGSQIETRKVIGNR